MSINITVSEPKKITEGDLAGLYVCQVYLPDRKISSPPFYADNQDEVISNAKKFIETYLQEKIKGIEYLLNERDIREKLTEELKWAKQELTRHKQDINIVK